MNLRKNGILVQVVDGKATNSYKSAAKDDVVYEWQKECTREEGFAVLHILTPHAEQENALIAAGFQFIERTSARARKKEVESEWLQ